MSFAKSSFQIIDENAFASRTNQKITRYVDRSFDNVFRDNINNREDEYNCFKNRVYVVDEEEKNFLEKFEEDFF